MDRVYCTRCGAASSAGNRFCVSCGERIEGAADARLADEAAGRGETVPDAPRRDLAAEKTRPSESNTCPKCGALNERWMSFCVSCGARIPSEPAAAPRASRFAPDASQTKGTGYPGSNFESQARTEPGGERPHSYDWGAHERTAPPPDRPVAGDGAGTIVSKSFSMYMSNLGLYFGVYWLVWLALMFAAFVAAAFSMIIPFVGNFAQMFATPIMVGVYYSYLVAMRGGRADIGLAFSCLSEKYIPALIATIVQTMLLIIPTIVIVIVAFGPSFMRLISMGGGASPADEWDFMLAFFKDAAGGIIVAIILLGLLKMLFMFVLPLIADHNVDFWRAITASVKFVYANFFEVIIVMILASLVAAAGILVLFIGLLFTMPLYFLIITAYYEARRDMFDL